MKKLILLIILLVPTLIFAQRFNGGALIGLNASQIDGDNWSGYNKAGLMAGAFVFTDFDAHWGAQLEVKYSQKGSASPKNSATIGKLRFQYVDIPIMATYKILDELKAQAGLSVNYLFKAEFWDAGWQEFDGPFNEFETAMVVGVNYRFLALFDVNVRFSYSLFPIRGDISGSSYGQGSWFNNMLSFGLYYQIGR